MFFHMYIAPGRGRRHIGWQNRKAFSVCPPHVASFKMISSKSDFVHIFNDFIHVHSPGAKAYNPFGTNFWCQQKALITLPIRCKFKKNKSDFIHIFDDFIYAYSPSARADNPLGTNFWCQQKALITLPICCRLKKKKALNSDFIYIFFMFHHMYIGQGQTIHWQQNFDDNRKAFSLCPYAASFKMISSKSFIHIFNDFIHVYSPGVRAENPLGTNFWCQQKALSTSTICCKFQTNLFEFWFYTHFFTFFHMYIASGQGQTTICGQNPDVNRKALSLCPFVASFKKKISLKSDFIHNFSCFYTCI